MLLTIATFALFDPEKFLIRPAEPADALILSQLICENAEAVLRGHYSDEQWAIFARYYSPQIMLHKIKTQHVFCAMLKGEVVGTIALDNDFVVGFYTKLQHFNKGIGKQLMKHLEEFARSRGLSEIQLAASPEGITFYNKNGWQKIKDVTMKYLDVDFEETLMVKKL
jgi:GNAT superfamily N-acetyltransferase